MSMPIKEFTMYLVGQAKDSSVCDFVSQLTKNETKI